MNKIKRVLATVTICTILTTSFGLLLVNANTDTDRCDGEIRILFDPRPTVD